LTMTGLALLGGLVPVLAEEGGKQKVEIPNPEPLVKAQGRAFFVGPDGVAREFKFGEEKKLENRYGGVRMELKVAPNQAGVEKLMNELKAAYEEDGLDRKFLKKALAGLRNFDQLADAKLHGFVVGPDGVRREVVLGNAAGMKPEKLEERVKEGGAALELGIEPGPDLVDFIGEVLGDDATPKRPGQGAGDPGVADLLGQAMKDPALKGLLQKGLSDPAAMKLMEQALKDGAARELMRQLLGGQAKPEPPKPAKPKAQEPAKPGAGKSKKEGQPKSAARARAKADEDRDAEVRELKREFKEQRAMLEKILGLLEER